MFPAVNLLVPSPLHLSLKDTQDITLFAFRDVWHTSVLAVIVVDSVLGMLSLNKLCKEKHLKLKSQGFTVTGTFSGRSHLVPLATLEGRSLYTRERSWAYVPPTVQIGFE